MSSRRVVAIIQARMGSKRLPAKVLTDIGGRTMLARVVERAGRSQRVDEVLVATSVASADDAIAQWCAGAGVTCVRGSEDDVLDRFAQAALVSRADIIVRITADCPLIDAEVIDLVVDAHLAGGADYTANCLSYTFPDGLDVEVFSRAALDASAERATLPSEREHVTAHIRRSGQFQIAPNVSSGLHIDGETYRWTVDEPADLEFVRRVYARLGADGNFGYLDIMRIIEEDRSMVKINEGIIANEGLYRAILNDPPMAAMSRPLMRSLELKERALRVIPSGTQTFSKGASQFVQGVAPVYAQRGKGSHLWDVDGNEYIDYGMALGPFILGYAHDEVDAAVREQMNEGACFTLPHPLEIEVSELLVKSYPGAEMARFGKNGSDATAGAVRAARAFTGRDIVVVCGYHGWQDWYIGSTTRNRGVPQAVRDLTKTFRYNDLESLRAVFRSEPGRIAAVIMEPYTMVEPDPGFLQGVKDIAHAEGALLIFDEIVTGYRLALGGGAEAFGVTPDLACLGKAIANGYPLSAVVGRRDVMEIFDEIFYSFTFGGETLSLAAAKATLRVMQEKDVIRHTREQGQKLRDGFTLFAKHYGIEAHAVIAGRPQRTVVSFKDAQGNDSLLYKSYFQQECLKRGVLFGGGQNVSLAHSEADTDHTLRAWRAAMELLAEGIRAGDVDKRLEGDPLRPVFKVRT